MSLDIARARMRNEHLIGPPLDRPEDVVSWLGAVQAQDYAGAKWAIGQRLAGCVDADIEQAYITGRILRTHVMRPTWHFVAPEDIRWTQELTSPRVRALMSYYDRKLELDEATFSRSSGVLGKVLCGGTHLTRTELSLAFANAGIETSGQRLGQLVMRAELDGLICSGPMRGKQHTYALLEERAPRGRRLRRDEALAELALRYFRSHGPALPQDFAWWSGLTVADAKAGIEMAKHELVYEPINGRTYWFSAKAPKARMSRLALHLLPNYDELLVAYRDHDPSLDPRLPSDRSLLTKVLYRHVIAANGLVVGGWRTSVVKGAVTIEARPLVPLSDIETKALYAAAERYGRFVRMSARIVVT